MTRRFVFAAMTAAAILLTATIVIAQAPNGLWPAPPQWESFEEMQDFYIRRFESAQGFGLSRMPQPPMLDWSAVS